METLIHALKIGCWVFGIFLFFFYGIMTWVVFHRLFKPLRKIIDQMKKYRERKLDHLPRIEIPDDQYLSPLVFAINDFSNQVQSLMEERNENQGILESLNEGILALDSQNQITYVNDIACKVLKLSKDFLMDINMDKISSVIIDFCKILILKCYKSKSIVTDSLNVDQLYYDVIGIPKSHNQGIILVFQDRTSEYIALKMGKDFIANASHELRTPITIIRGFAETLQDLSHLSKKDLSKITEKIVRTCERLTKLVSNLLVLADLDNQSAIQSKKTPINTLIENCQHMLLTLYPKAQLKMHFSEEELYIDANADLLELAIMNLLENAVKYSNVPAQIHIYVQQENQELTIRIQDSGIGISKAQLEHIFERFFTVDKNRSRRYGGAGLGLSIVKSIVEKHNGKLEVESSEYIGSTFIMHLPTHSLLKI